MNERIKELADQFGPVATIGNWGRVEWSDNVYPQLGDRMHAYIDLQKFAELIIQECITQCEEVATDSDTVVKSDYVTDAGRMLHRGMWGGAKNCSGRIKDHFGVEE